MSRTAPLERFLRRPLDAADAACNRLIGWRYNPLYQSGTIAVLMLVALIVTGIWLLLFYRVGSPWASVDRLTANHLTGNWVRGLHRYTSDVALLAVGVHALRMFVQGRSWGPRGLAWLSGLVLVGVMLLCGWTGYIMVWDGFGLALAQEMARLLDAIPVLSEPVQRAFVGERPIPSTFFFLNLFAHSALPLAIGLGLWLHVSRLARPTLLPPRRFSFALMGLLTVVAVAWPLRMAPEADPLRLPASVPADWFYAWWLPLTRPLPAGAVWALALLLVLAAVLVPTLARPRAAERLAPSVVDRDICTGCTQCALDCPYEAIAMQSRSDGRAQLVGVVNPDRCVSCGICAGSCAPMGVGPAGHTGRAQLARVRAQTPTWDGAFVVYACRKGKDAVRAALESEGARVMPVECAGNLHSSAVEYAVRAGASGVLILGCPPRDCWGREGPKWLGERLFRGREAELKPRVDRRRLRVAYAGGGEAAVAVAELRRLREQVAPLDRPLPERAIELEALCEPLAAVEDT